MYLFPATNTGLPLNHGEEKKAIISNPLDVVMWSLRQAFTRRGDEENSLSMVMSLRQAFTRRGDEENSLGVVMSLRQAW